MRPVLHVDSLAPADAYEVPAAMREAIALRHPASVFPYSGKRARLDLDHTIPYVPGAAGQTRPDNLGPLARREHRAKTHGSWQVTQPLAGVFLWRSPQGFVYAVTQSGTWELHDPTAAPREGPDACAALAGQPVTRPPRERLRARQEARVALEPPSDEPPPF